MLINSAVHGEWQERKRDKNVSVTR